MKKYLSILLALLLVFQITGLALAEIPPGTSNVNGMVIGGWLRLRGGPGYTYQTIASLPVNSVVKVNSTDGDWCRVTTAEGATGYMSRFFLNVTSNPIHTPGGGSSGSGGGYQGTVYSYNGGNVRLRSGPSYSYGVIGTYPVGTPLHVISHGSNWDYVQIGSQSGYMRNEFIRVGGGSVPTPPSGGGYVAYVTSRNGKGVRLRTDPNSNAAILGLYSVGTQVTVLQHNVRHGWDYIQIGSRTGYMMNRFLTTNPNVVPPQNNVVRDVTLSTTTPRPGDTVYVFTIVPSNADVGFRWKLGANIIGTNSSQVMPGEANGKIVTLEVYGKNSFTGTVTKTLFVNAAPTSALLDVTLNKVTAEVGHTLSVTALNPPNATASYTWELDGAVISYANSLVVPASAAGKQIKFRATGTGSFAGTVNKVVNIAGVPITPPPTPPTTYSLVLSGPNAYDPDPNANHSIMYEVNWTPWDIATGPQNLSVKWYRDGALVQENNMYVLTEQDKGKTIKCVATFNTADGASHTVEASKNIAP